MVEIQKFGMVGRGYVMNVRRGYIKNVGRGYVIQNSHSVSQSGSDEGRYRAARAAKKLTKNTSRRDKRKSRQYTWEEKKVQVTKILQGWKGKWLFWKVLSTFIP